MNYKNILIKLHSKFPQFDTDTLIEILNCMEENYYPTSVTTPAPGISWTNDSALHYQDDLIVCKAADAIKTNLTTYASNRINKAEALD